MHRPPRPTTAARLTAAAALTGALAVTAAPPAWAGSAATRAALTSTDTSPPQLRKIWFSRSSVAVAGLAVVPVTVSVRLTDPSGIAEIPYDMEPSPRLTLGPVPGFQSKLRPVLSRTSGTVKDGVWSATVNVPSTWNGTVRVESVGATDRAGNVLSKKVAGPKLRVKGTHRPALTFHYEVLRGGGFRIHGRAYFTDTGRPIPRRKLAALYEQGCDLEGRVATNIVTDARGYYQKRWPNGETKGVGCVALISAAAREQRPTVHVYRTGNAPRS